MTVAKNNGIWCNGNTTDSGPVIPGSSPGIPTTSKSKLNFQLGLFCFTPPTLIGHKRDQIILWENSLIRTVEIGFFRKIE